MKAQTFIDKKIYLPKAKVRQWGKVETKTKPQKLARRVCYHEKKGLRSRQKGFALTTKRVCAHDKKGLRSRQKRFHLTSANSPLGFSLFHCLCSCARFRDFCLLIQALSALKDQPLGVVCDEKNAKFYLERAKDYADKGISGGG